MAAGEPIPVREELEQPAKERPRITIVLSGVARVSAVGPLHTLASAAITLGRADAERQADEIVGLFR